MRPEDADLAIAEWPAIVEVGSDPATVQIDGLVAGGGIDPTTEVDLPQAVLVTPAFDQRVDVLVVEGQGLGLDEPVLLAPAGVAGMDVVDVQATVDVLHAAVDERPTEDVLVVKDRPCGVVAADPPVEIGAPGQNVVRREPDLRERRRRRIESHAFPLRLAIPGERPIPPAVLLVVPPRFAFVDLATVRIGKVDLRISKRRHEFRHAIRRQFVVVVDFDQHVAPAGQACEPFQFADVLRLAFIGNDPHFPSNRRWMMTRWRESFRPECRALHLALSFKVTERPIRPTRALNSRRDFSPAVLAFTPLVEKSSTSAEQGFCDYGCE